MILENLDPSLAQTLSITWSLNDPPLAASQWFFWSPDLLNELRPQSNDLIESILIKAFELRLPRTMGWDLSLLPKHEQQAAQKAASLFRRGVASRLSSEFLPSAPLKGSYNIQIVTQESLPLFISKPAFYVIDQQVRPHLPFDLGDNPQSVIHLTEKSKDLTSLSNLRQSFKKLGRKLPWVIIGGGIISDVAACAATLEKAPFILIPTTLLAMVDACVGGKTGVNFPPYGKNQLGRFAFPEACVMWPGWLRTLPEREYNAGIAECIKHSLLSNRGLVFLRSQDRTINADTLRQLIEFKADIVSQDPAEQGLRASLNFGHTLAHALEAKSHAIFSDPQRIILHGEAVAYGLVFALFVSHRLAGLPRQHLNESLKRLRESGCLGSTQDIQARVFEQKIDASTAFNELIPWLLLDKKAGSAAKNHLSMTLLAASGQPNPGPLGRYVFEVPLDEAHQAFHEFWQFIS